MEEHPLGQHIMIDLETLGTRPGSVILSIGAVVFDLKTGKLGAEFYKNISRASCEKAGLTTDASTVVWWEQQSPEAKAALEPDQVTLLEALAAFTDWFARVGGECVWGHGASFDPVLLESAYRAERVLPPWKFWNVRCCRTVLALGNRTLDKTRFGQHHNALDDAKSQAMAVAAALRLGVKA